MSVQGRNSRWLSARSGLNFLVSSLLVACMTAATLAAGPDESRPKSGDLVRKLNQVPKLIPNSEIDHLRERPQGPGPRQERECEPALRGGHRSGAEVWRRSRVPGDGLPDEVGCWTKPSGSTSSHEASTGDYRMPTVNLASVYLMRGQNRKAVRNTA